VARAPSRQLLSLSISRSSSAILEWAQISSTVREDCAAAISTPRSGEQFLHKPRWLFQQLFRHTQPEQRGHWMKSGRNSSMAAVNASSCAFSQLAERARSPRSAAWPNNPPNRLPAAFKASVTRLRVDAWKRVRKPYPQRSQ